jgi:cell fate (sporulation/competence/biofilm development) regulator YlbF (YheA/YmcA/DUF963 family)
MVEVENELYALVVAVKRSETYKEYDRWRNILKTNPELFERVNEYRTENYKLQTSEDDGTLEERIEKFAAENEELSEEPRVRAFLDAEVALCRMLQEITNRVVKGIDFE